MTTATFQTGVHEKALEQIPDAPSCESVLARATQILAPSILNHSIRVFLLARWLAEQEQSEWCKYDNLPILFVACICHDFGTSDE